MQPFDMPHPSDLAQAEQLLHDIEAASAPDTTLGPEPAGMERSELSIAGEGEAEESKTGEAEEPC